MLHVVMDYYLWFATCTKKSPRSLHTGETRNAVADMVQARFDWPEAVCGACRRDLSTSWRYQPRPLLGALPDTVKGNAGAARSALNGCLQSRRRIAQTTAGTGRKSSAACWLSSNAPALTPSRVCHGQCQGYNEQDPSRLSTSMPL